MFKPQAIYFSHGWEGLDQNSRGQTLAQTYGVSLATYLPQVSSFCHLLAVCLGERYRIFLFFSLLIWKVGGKCMGKIGVCSSVFLYIICSCVGDTGW